MGKVRTQQEIFNERIQNDVEFAREYDRRRNEIKAQGELTTGLIEYAVEVGKPIVQHALEEMETTGEPGLSGWGRTHQSLEGRERERINRTIRAHWNGPGDSGLTDQNVTPKLPDIGGTFGHKDAGLLHLIATGDGGWLLRVRGGDFGFGKVGRRERDGDTLTPSKRTLELAAAKALEVGPENPPDAVMFVGDEELTVAEFMVRQGMIK